MTVGTNALLEGKTARTALVATEGFTDLEELGRQARPELYRLCAAHPPPVVPPSCASRRRSGAGPTACCASSTRSELAERLRALAGDVEAVAVCLLWGFRHPEHERAAAERERRAARRARLAPRTRPPACSASTSAWPRRWWTPPSPPCSRATSRGSPSAPARPACPTPEVMLSSGGVAERRDGRRARLVDRAVGPRRRRGGGGAGRPASGGAVGLDMGGTSCDVSLVLDGRVAVTGGREVGGRSLALPMVDVHTVGAGGGSIAWRDDGRRAARRARSRRAPYPGPACYGRGGERAHGDRRQPAAGLPRPGGAAGRRRRARPRRRRARGGRAGRASWAWRSRRRPRASCAWPNAEMAQAVRVVTVERGIDPRELALVAFGGAGPLHAARDRRGAGHGDA